MGLTDAEWRKSSYSTNVGNCVEVTVNLPGVVAVRDSKDPVGPALVFTADEWRAFLSGAHAGAALPPGLTSEPDGDVLGLFGVIQQERRAREDDRGAALSDEGVSNT